MVESKEVDSGNNSFWFFCQMLVILKQLSTYPWIQLGGNYEDARRTKKDNRGEY